MGRVRCRGKGLEDHTVAAVQTIVPIAMISSWRIIVRLFRLRMGEFEVAAGVADGKLVFNGLFVTLRTRQPEIRKVRANLLAT